MKQFNYILILILIPVSVFGQGYNVGELTINYYDSARSRPVNTEIWYPTSDSDQKQERNIVLPFVLPPTIRNANFPEKTFPLIILSHGTGGNKFSLAWLAIELAKNGYIVASPDHWGNTFDNKIPEYFVRYWDRPLDISFLLTSMLSDISLAPHINVDRIGLVGFSFGGYTALAIGGVQLDCGLLKRNANTKQGKKEFTIPELGNLVTLIDALDCGNIPLDFHDNRFKVIVAMAPALGLGLPETMQHTSSPILIIGAEADKIAPLETNALKYHKYIPDSEFINLEGNIGHYIFLNEASEDLKKEAKQYYKDDKSVDRGLIHDQVSKEILRFIGQKLK